MFQGHTLSRILFPFRGSNGSGGLRTITLDNSTIPDSTTVGSLVGNLTATGIAGPYLFSLTSNPGSLFSVTATTLLTAGSVTAGSYTIGLRADHGGGDTIDQTFNITVTATGGGGTTADDDWAAEVAAAG